MTKGVISVFYGKIVHCNDFFTIETYENGFIAVQDNKILAIDNLSEFKEIKNLKNWKNVQEIRLKKNQLLLPGLIDTHLHAPQFPNSGLGYDKCLLEWLQNYTYPLEKLYDDVKFATKVYDTVVKRSLAAGSTTVCYFATLHLESSLILADAAIKHGQRAFIGKVNMTKLAPSDYIEDSIETIHNTLEFIREVHKKRCNLVKPIITPRFSLSLTMEEMKKLGLIAYKNDLNIQSHISENKDEIDMVTNEFNGLSYAEVYDEANLLTRKTVLAHGVHLTDSEMKLLAKRETSISHCPNSNTCLKSGLTDVKKLIHYGVNVGLGTDMSGGYAISMMNAMRSTVAVSTHISFDKNDDYHPLNIYDAFYMATMGGAKALDLEEEIGNFKVGKEFDAIVAEVTDCFQQHTVMELLQKFLYTGDDRNVVQVYVSGKRVKK